ncbi:MAG: tyrosine phenol-lyase [Ignavibacteria bacterium GWA2_54_16]|nr:MAG: tyrosine phenol-lyase [Ignavibacteria bacterium GWA2_54_16]
MKTIIEPFKIKSVEPIQFTTEAERHDVLRKAFFNPFLIHADDVLIDLLTDSGTSAMSAKQWAGILDGDEAYAGSRSFFRFEKAVRALTGLKHIIPTHQGRAAEKIIFTIMGGKGKVIPNNTHFDTTRANVEFSGAEAVDLPTDEGKKPDLIADFKGNMNIPALKALIERVGPRNIPLCMITITNNSGGGQPVSMANIRETKQLLKQHDIPLFLDACRFAENAFFIKKREPGYSDKSAASIAREMFSHADGCTMSAKKDAFVNMGGFLALNDDSLAVNARNLLIVTEGFTTYGGLAGRDLEAIAQGLEEIVDEHYLTYRIRSVEYLGQKLVGGGVPIVEPPGGHAIYLDAKRFAPHLRPDQFPGQAIVCELYRAGGIRSVEIGSVMFGKYDSAGKLFSPPMELVRLAIPRRVYTQSHIDYVIEVVLDVFARRHQLKGFRIVEEAPVLRHFTAKFEPLAS